MLSVGKSPYAIALMISFTYLCAIQYLRFRLVRLIIHTVTHDIDADTPIHADKTTHHRAVAFVIISNKKNKAYNQSTEATITSQRNKSRGSKIVDGRHMLIIHVVNHVVRRLV